MANPSKGGDAKPWVYRCTHSHDRQVTEDEPMTRTQVDRAVVWMLAS